MMLLLVKGISLVALSIALVVLPFALQLAALPALSAQGHSSDHRYIYLYVLGYPSQV